MFCLKFKEYYAPVKKAKKGENTQEGHEGIRVVDLNMTPDRLSKYIKDEKLLFKSFTLNSSKLLKSLIFSKLYISRKIFYSII